MREARYYVCDIYRVPTQIAFSNLLFSLSDCKLFPCQFTSFVTITYTKLTWQIYPASGKKWEFSQQISQYRLPLESGNLQLEQTKCPVFALCFGKISKFPVFSLTEQEYTSSGQ